MLSALAAEHASRFTPILGERVFTESVRKAGYRFTPLYATVAIFLGSIER